MGKNDFKKRLKHRRRTNPIVIILLFALLSADGCSEDDKRIYIPYPGSGDTLNFTFQDGSNPFPDYRGTRDAVLKSSSKEYNFGNVPIDTIGILNTGGDIYELRLIIAFDLSIIESCSEVLEAGLSLSLSSTGSTDSITLEAYRVSSPALSGTTWMEGTGGYGEGVSWLTIDGGAPWGNEGGDYINTLLDRVTAAGDTVVTFDLPPSLVFDWISNPENNHGILVIPRTQSSSSYTLVHMRETLESNYRPALSIKFIKGG